MKSRYTIAAASSLLSASLLVLCPLVLSGCGEAEGPKGIAEKREVEAPKLDPDASTAERIGFSPIGAATDPHAGVPGAPAIGDAAEAASADDGHAAFDWAAPEGWADAGERMMRLVTYTVGAKTECYLSVAGGDNLMNVNRWRAQMALDPITQDELAALPTISMLGKDALRVDLEGSFTGMQGDAQAGYMMIAVACPLEGGQSLFVKMTGPADEVKAQEANFTAFCASIQPHTH